MAAGGVLQGRFTSAGPRLPGPGGVAQPRAHGNAQPLPPGLIRTGGAGGRPLPDAVRTKMEGFFKTDFSDVRIHVGSEAPAIGALAFTLGSSIYMAPGQYNPDTPHGQQLLGHELTHVLQQRAGRVRNPFGSGIAVVQDPGLEAEADRMGMRAAAYTPAPAIQRKPAPPRGQEAQPKGDDARGSGYRLIVGAYMHQQKGLPEPMAGHGFVAIERPGGRREAYGFSPAGFSGMDPKRDLGRLMSGVPGRVHRDEQAFSKPGVRTRSIPVTREQADRALAKVNEYQGKTFSLANRQCTTFAADVAGAAGVGRVAGGNPRSFYRGV